MRPTPPNCRTTSGPHPRRPKCRRLGVRMRTKIVAHVLGGRLRVRREALPHGRLANMTM